MSTLVRSATVRLLDGHDSELVERVGWLGDILAETTQAQLRMAWSAEAMQAFAEPALPRQAFVAWERCFGRPQTAVHLDSRALRMALARAGELLRSQAHQAAIVTAILESRVRVPGTAVEQRNTRRRIRSYEREHGRRPSDFFDLAPDPPQVRPAVATGATDQQFTSWHQVRHDQAVLRIKLPTVPRPASRRDWAWAELTVRFADSTRAHLRAGATLGKPTLLVRRGHLGVSVVCSRPAPEPIDDPRAPILGLDWGERRLLTGALVRRLPRGDIATTGRPVFFESKGAQAHLARLRRQASLLRGKHDRVKALHDGRPTAALQDKLDVLQAELDRVWRHYRDLSDTIAQAAARWAVEQARARGASVIAVEDLRSLEARTHSRSVNARVNHQLRSRIFAVIESLAAEHRIAFRQVPAAHTSARCSRCLASVRHQKAANNTRPGRGWAHCPACGHSADRDHSAAERVAALGLDPDHRRVRLATQPLLAAPAPRPRRRAIASPLPSPPVAHDPSAAPAGHASRVRRGVSPGAFQPPQVTEPRLVPTRSTKSSRSGHRHHRNLTGMHDGLRGHVRFTHPTRAQPPRPSCLRKLRNE